MNKCKMFRKVLTQNTHSIKILGIVFKSAVVMEYVSYGAYVLDRRYSKKKFDDEFPV